MESQRIGAVIVLYKPDIEFLYEQLSAIDEKVSLVVFIDNSEGSVVPDIPKTKTKKLIIKNEVNLGVASALNQGMACLIKNEIFFALLLDQDSLPQQDMIDSLQKVLLSCHHDKKVIAVGPEIIRVSQSPIVEFEVGDSSLCGEVKGVVPYCEDVVGNDFLISSGMMINLTMLNSVGAMDDGLFIDNVDLEWCFRVKYAGYSLIRVRNAKLFHQIGTPLRVLFFFTITWHNPTRQYYIFRNRLLMYRNKYTPVSWIAADVPRMLAKALLYVFFIQPRIENLKMIFFGAMDAIRLRKGPLKKI